MPIPTVTLDYPSDGATVGVPFAATGHTTPPGAFGVVYDDTTGAVLGGCQSDVSGAYAVPVSSLTANCFAAIGIGKAIASVIVQSAAGAANVAATGIGGAIASVLEKVGAAIQASGVSSSFGQSAFVGPQAQVSATGIGASIPDAVSVKAGASLAATGAGASLLDSANPTMASGGSGLFANPGAESALGGSSGTYPSNPTGNWFGYTPTVPSVTASYAFIVTDARKIAGTGSLLVGASGGYDAGGDAWYDAVAKMIQRLTASAINATPTIGFAVRAGSSFVPANCGCYLEARVYNAAGTDITITAGDQNLAKIAGTVREGAAAFGANADTSLVTALSATPATKSGFNLKTFVTNCATGGWAVVDHVDFRLVLYGDASLQYSEAIFDSFVAA